MDRLTIRMPNGVIKRNEVMGDSVMARLAAYEDTGLAPREVESLKVENARLREELEAANARWEETASDNTGYTLLHIDGSYTVSDPQGHVVCEFMRERAENGGTNETD